MSFHQDQIKKKLLQVDLQIFRKHELQIIKIHKKTLDKYRKQSNLQLSEWSTHQKTGTLTSFPTLQFSHQNLRKNKLMQNTPNYASSYLTKTGFKQKQSSPAANQINLSFNPQEVYRYKARHKKSSNLIPKSHQKNEQKQKKFSLERYLINGQIKMKPLQRKQFQSNNNRSTHLIRLLRQRQILRRKRYSFDLDSGFMAKSYFNL